MAGRDDTAIDLERQILALCLYDAEAVLEADRVFSDDSVFADPRHAHIWRAALSIQRAGRLLDPVAVRLELSGTGSLDAAGGTAYLSEIAGAAPVSALPLDLLIEKYGSDIRRRAVRSELLRSLAAIDDPRSGDAAAIADDLVAKMSDIAAATSDNGLRHIADAVDAVAQNLDAGFNPGTPTCIEPLDRAIQGGIKPSQLIVVAGSTGSGKTALATQIALRAAGWASHKPEERGPVLFFSFEMNQEELISRMLMQMTPQLRDGYRWAEPDKGIKGGFSDRDKPIVRDSLSKMRSLPIHIVDDSVETIDAVRSEVERFIAHESGRLPSLIVIDHIGLLSAPSAAKNGRTAEVGAITRGLKNMARRLRVPVLALAQLNRQAGQRDDHRPRLNDLRESGTIEQDANIVILIHRESYYKQPDIRKQEEEAGAETEINIAKNRAGPTDKVLLTWYGTHTVFAVPAEYSAKAGHAVEDPFVIEAMRRKAEAGGAPAPTSSGPAPAPKPGDLSSVPVLGVPADPGPVSEDVLFA
jgi:replicative DNA helicase